MILLMRMNQEFHLRTNLLKAVTQTLKKELRRSKGKMIKINLLVGQEIKLIRLHLVETKIQKQDE
jgi:hypothetical protein